jgi:hypothetical protein
MVEACDDWLLYGLTTFPHDTDIGLIEFKEWAEDILENNPIEWEDQ